MKTHQKLFLGLMACAFFGSCSSNQQQETVSDNLPYTVIPFGKGVENEKKVKLSEIAEKITFVPMETTDASLIAKPKLMNIVYVDGIIVIPCSVGLLAFDEKGKFLNTISQKGQGPKEYVQLLCVSANEELGVVYLQTGHKMMTYYPNGTFVKENRIPVGLSLETLVMEDSITISSIWNNTGKKPYRLLLSDTKGDTLKAFPQYDHFEMPEGWNWIYRNSKEDNLFSYKGEVVYRDYYSDTIYTVTRDTLLPRYLLEMGKYQLPKDLRLEVAFVTNDRERDEKLKLAENYLRPTLLENDRYIVMPYTTWNIWDRSLPSYLMLYDRKTKECIKVKDGAFVNDMMGDLPFCPDVRIAENVLAEWWDASELMELAEEGVKLPDNLKNLKEDDNGVLVLVHLKK